MFTFNTIYGKCHFVTKMSRSINNILLFDFDSSTIRYTFADNIYIVLTLKTFTKMAKGNLFLGYGRGKVGDIVLMRKNGTQVARAYNGQPKDANTRSQAEQRSLITNIIRLYQSSPSFFEKAFENKKENRSDYNELVSINMKRTPKVYLPKSIADNNGGVVAPYRITAGSLQNILVTGTGADAVTNIAVGDITINASYTVGELTEAILANNTFIMEGDQLSYLSIEQYTDNGTPKLRARKYEMILTAGDSTPVLNVFPVQAVAVVDGFIGHGALVYSGAFAWILSRRENGKLKVSTQDLVVTSDALYQPYVGSDAATRASVSYGASDMPFLDTGESGSGSAVPSNRPSVASVSINDSTITSGDGDVSISEHVIPAGKLVITGSALQDVSQISITAKGQTADDPLETVHTQTITVPVTAAGDVQLSNTSEVDLVNIDLLESLSISISGRSVYSWSASGDGGTTDDPLV